MVGSTSISCSLLAWLDDLARVNHSCSYLSTLVTCKDKIWLRNWNVDYEIIDIIVSYDICDVLLVLELFLFGIQHFFWVKYFIVISNIFYLNVIHFSWKRFDPCFIVTCLGLIVEVNFLRVLRIPNLMRLLRVVALFVRYVDFNLNFLAILRAGWLKRNFVLSVFI